MSQIIDQAEELRTQAIALLLQERETIDRKLEQLGYDGMEVTKSRKQIACGKCGAAGHTARTCRTIPEEPRG